MTDDGTKNKTCATCKWWKNNSNRCQRFPPQLVVTKMGSIIAYWPSTFEYDFCGEWLRKTTNE